MPHIDSTDRFTEEEKRLHTVCRCSRLGGRHRARQGSGEGRPKRSCELSVGRELGRFGSCHTCTNELEADGSSPACEGQQREGPPHASWTREHQAG